MWCLPYPYMLILRHVCMVSLLCCLNKALCVSWMGLCRGVLPSPYEASSCSCSRQQLVAESVLTLLSGGSILSHRLIVLHTAFLHPEDADCKYCSTHASALNHSPSVVNPIVSPSVFPRILQINSRSQGQTSISQYYISNFFFVTELRT